MSKNQVLISIIMPVHNTGKYLPDCIDSIKGQTQTDWELIAVNNGSTDDSLSILDAYAKVDSRIKVIHLKEANLLQALREGYKASNGVMIHRMDSDDKMPADKLKSMSEALKAQGHDTVITGGTSYFNDEGTVGDGFRRYDAWLCEVARANSHRAEIYKECVIPSNCWLVYREDFDKVEAFNPDVFPEDYDLSFRFYANNLKIVGLDQVLHLWRDRPDRISRNWEVYKDNRFFDLKVHYFNKVERDMNRPLVIWGAGKNGKDLIKLFQMSNQDLHWVCDNDRKIGKDIYGIRMESFEAINSLDNPQIIIPVASPDGQVEIESYLLELNKKKGTDYWFFS